MPVSKWLLLLFLTVNSSIFLIHGATGINQSKVQQGSKSYRKYLEDMSWKVSAPWPLIEASANVLGLSQTEIDAIPVSFPFLYGEKYKGVFHLLETPAIIGLINFLMVQFENKSGGLSSAKKRELLHQLIHELVLKELGLALTTTTKQLATLVSKGTISISRLSEIQLAAFFVKYYLDL